MKKTVFYLILLSLLLVFAYSAYRLYGIFQMYKHTDEVYEEIAEQAVQIRDTTVNTSEPDNKESTIPPMEFLESQPAETLPDPAIKTYDIPVPISVDFELLHEINEDIVGWLYCEGTSINYPVLQGETNDTYLRHQYDGVYNYAGSIFMDYRCESDFSDDYTIIYGHNMLSDSMFNCLDYFRDEEYLREHSRFFYLTPSGKNYCLEVACVNLTAYKDDLRLFELRDDERNIELIRSQAEADTGIEITNEDHLVLLATCTYDYKDAKCTLLCKAVELY